MTRFFLIAFLSLAIVLPVMAQTPTPLENTLRSREQTRDTNQNLQETVGEIRNTIREEVQVTNQGILTEAQRLRQEIKTQFEVKREEAKNIIEKKREEFEKAVEQKRIEVQARAEARKQELKARLAKIKDENKRKTVERIDAQMAELNKRVLDHLIAVLGKLENIMERVDGRADKAAANGYDVAAVKTAIKEAEEAIAASRKAIEAQTGKVYTIVVSTEDALRTDVGRARQALHEDLSKARESVRQAHDAVRRAAVALAQIPRVDEFEVSENDSFAPGALNQPAATSGQQ